MLQRLRAGTRSRPARILAILVLLAAVGGVVAGRAARRGLPDVRSLEDYTPPVMTRVLARDGSVVATFAQQRRILIPYRDLPEVLVQALVATEDARFFQHRGLDFRGILRAAWHDLTHLELAQGASTLTQQLARGLFLHPEKLWRRKVQEMILAMEIERTYSKEEILTFYCNQIYLGHGQYGIEAASRYYFGKHARDLTLPEAALLVGIIQRPESLSPYRHPDRALKRRNHVLRRMVDEGFLAPEEAEAAMKAPLEVSPNRRVRNPAPYFVEEVRRWLQQRFGDQSLYEAGLEVRTTLDRRLQEIANQAVEMGLRQLDKRQGWRGVDRRVPEESSPEEWMSPAWDEGFREGRVTDAVVTSAQKRRGTVEVRIGPYRAVLGPEETAWTRKGKPASFLKPGDVIRVRLRKLDAEQGTARVELEQEPAVEAALVAVEPRTGAIRALVGGFDFNRSEFDRAIQARRQTGSAFKPFVYAAALAQGWTPASRLLDIPTVFLDPHTAEPYQPENFGWQYHGAVTLRRALEMSANIATVRLLSHLGYEPVIEMARRLGIRSELRPFPSLALGSFEISLLELTSAYATFANQGIRVEPHFVDTVRERDGSVAVRVEPPVQDAVTPQIAYLMNLLLEGVITDGTGRAAASLGRPLAGKTGTTDDNTDAWFVGYAPDLAVGVWVGYDVKKSLGSRETGSYAALPIWTAFMQAAYAGRPPEDFPRPPGLTQVAIHRDSGLRANPSAACFPVLAESFLQGTEPTRFCSRAEHAWLRLPYPFQRFPLNDRGELEVPSTVLDLLVAEEPSVRWGPTGMELEVISGDGIFHMPVRRVLSLGGEADPIPPRLRSLLEDKEIDPETWRGKDGRRVDVVVLPRR